jgi:hypothetical protein
MRLDSQKARIGIMDDIEYAGRASSQQMTSTEQDNKASQTKYRQDMMAKELRRIASKRDVCAWN